MKTLIELNKIVKRLCCSINKLTVPLTTYTNNTAAKAAGLKAGDQYYLPVNADNYVVATVV